VLNIASPQAYLISVEVFDIRGRKITSTMVNSQNSYQLDMSALESAVYFVKISTNVGEIIKRVMKE